MVPRPRDERPLPNRAVNNNEQSLNTPRFDVPDPIRVGMVNLGCAKNLVDAEIMLGSIKARGMDVTADAEKADVLVINTCAFIDAAKEESIDAIFQAHEQRQSLRPHQKL